MRALLALVAGLGIVSHAQAADLPVKAVPVPAAIVFNWTGVYVGAHLGGAWSRTTISTADAAALIATYGGVPEPDGIIGGAQIGYNYQLPNNLVLGLEIAGGFGPGFSDSVSIPGVSSLKTEGRWYTAVTGRVGYAVNNWLPYLAGGIAWGGNRASAVTPFGTGVFENTHVGYHIGGGLEYAFTRNFSLGVDYRFFEFEKRTYGGVSTGSQISAVTLRGNYRF